MRKSVIITLFIIYIASIVIIGYFGTKVKSYDTNKYVKGLEISITATNADCYELIKNEKDGYVVIDETSGYEEYNLKLRYTKYKQNNRLDVAIVPIFLFADGEKEKRTGREVSYQIDGLSSKNQDKITVDENGNLAILKSGLTCTLYIRPIGTGQIRVPSSTGIKVNVSIY